MASKHTTFLLLLFLSTFTIGCGGILADADAPNAPKLTPDLRERALAELREGLSHSRGWVKVHAAAALLRLGYLESVRDQVEAELPAAEIEPGYRIGVWQTLALSAVSDTERAKWTSRILGAALDPSAGDRQHALEALAKLEYAAGPVEQQALRETASNAPLAVYARWVLASSGARRTTGTWRSCSIPRVAQPHGCGLRFQTPQENFPQELGEAGTGCRQGACWIGRAR